MPIKIGGLMRCCLHTMYEYIESQGCDDEGIVVPCKYCKSSVIARGRCWEWNREGGPKPTRESGEDAVSSRRTHDDPMAKRLES